MNKIEIKRGDIFYVDLPKNRKNIQSGIRPCVVVSNDKANTFAPVIHVIPLTTRIKRMLPTHVILNNKYLPETSVAMAEQELLVNKDQLLEKLGSCSRDELMKINKTILVQNGLLSFVKELMIETNNLVLA